MCSIYCPGCCCIYVSSNTTRNIGMERNHVNHVLSICDSIELWNYLFNAIYFCLIISFHTILFPWFKNCSNQYYHMKLKYSIPNMLVYHSKYVKPSLQNNQGSDILFSKHHKIITWYQIIYFEKYFFLTVLVAIATIQNMISYRYITKREGYMTKMHWMANNDLGMIS